MRTPFIAANWKMFKTVHEAVVFAKEFRSLVKDIADVEIVVAPPFTALHAVAEAVAELADRRGRPEPVLGARRARSRERSARAMLKEAGAEYVIIGHSERRRLFDETDETVNRKLAGRARRAAHADRLHRRDARGARARARRWPSSIGRSRRGSTA